MGSLLLKHLQTYQAATAETDQERNNLNLSFSSFILEEHILR